MKGTRGRRGSPRSAGATGDASIATEVSSQGDAVAGSGGEGECTDIEGLFQTLTTGLIS